ncbi:MAG TPA: hotdog fold thioesterase [Symbiobacteriaceae bacterium]|nr:hotdog fold thioesterase [Symbiobacteriaceae bacterium]
MANDFQAMRHGTAVEALGIELVLVEKERVVATMPVDHRTRQPFGLLHGGASVLLAETVASIGGQLNAPEGMAAVGMEINANHLRSKREGLVRATATPIHVGRTSSIWSIEIADEAGKLVCVSRCTIAFVPMK